MAIGVVAALLVAALTTSRVTIVLSGLLSILERLYLLGPQLKVRGEVRARKARAKVDSLARGDVV